MPEVVFGSSKENDKRLFNLLQKAYIDARYKSDYNINVLDLTELTNNSEEFTESFKAGVTNCFDLY